MQKYIIVIIFVIFMLLSVSAFQYRQFHDGLLHVIFCDVGQGDGILIRTPSGKLILVDGGPDEKILGCLQRHTPFWERSIAIMFLSHPHADHLNGLIPVLERYITKYFVSEKLANTTAGYQVLHSLLNAKQIPQKTVFLGDSMKLSDGVSIRILSPTPELLESTSPHGIVGESKEFANLIMLISFKEFDVLLVGDSQAAQVESASQHIRDQLEVMQVAHHGSMTGLSEAAIHRLRPQLAVISVGKNTYGHPSPYIHDLLKRAHIPVKETIQEGDIDIISNGLTFRINE